MIDLGKHALHVYLSYGATSALIIGLIVQSVLASRATKARLKDAEDER